MTRSALRPALLALGAAIALGLAGRIAVHAGAGLPHGAALGAAGHAAVALGAPWLVVAWAVGAMSGGRLAGAFAGGVTLAAGTFAWYSLSVAAGGVAKAYYAWPVAPAWAVVALAAGAAVRLGGALWRGGGGAGGGAAGGGAR